MWDISGSGTETGTFPLRFKNRKAVLLRYAIRRLAITLPLLLGISLLTFGILHLAPGSPVQAETAMNPRASAESIRILRQLYGMDRPLHVQYLSWLNRLLHFDFGVSFKDQR